jgi:hypothetical protein
MTTSNGHRAHGPRGRHRRPLPRTLHLIDLENLCPRGLITRANVERVWALYQSRVGVWNDDGVVVAVEGRQAFTVAAALPTGIRLLTGRGRDGADRALLSVVDIAWAKRSFDRVVVASGDHVFAPSIRAYQAAGVPVELVAGCGGVARVLTDTGVPVHRLKAA